MKKREIKDSGASIRARLTNIAKETKRDFDALLLQYFQERFLYRLSISSFRSAFIYDILFLASHQAFDMHLLHKAIVKTFNRRGTPIEDRKSIFKKSLNLQKRNRPNG